MIGTALVMCYASHDQTMHPTLLSTASHSSYAQLFTQYNSALWHMYTDITHPVEHISFIMLLLLHVFCIQIPCHSAILHHTIFFPLGEEKRENKREKERGIPLLTEVKIFQCSLSYPYSSVDYTLYASSHTPDKVPVITLCVHPLIWIIRTELGPSW